MTTYRVGPAGATIFNEAGEPLLRLRPGQVVVEGTIDTAGSLAAQHAENEAVAKRVRSYPDKKLRVAEDKATPPRQPDQRLRNPLAGSG